MDTLFEYTQTKRERRTGLASHCNLSLYSSKNSLTITGDFDSEYLRFGVPKKLELYRSLTINLKNGNIESRYLINRGGGLPKDSKTKNGKNNFKLVHDFVQMSYFRGEKRVGYWGVRFQRKMNDLFDIIHSHFMVNIQDERILTKDYNYNLFELLVDYHLAIKNIKAHDHVYETILTDYPKQKFLKENDNKYIQSVLDGYGIKSSYLVNKLHTERGVSIKTINYLLKLFDNDVNYLKEIDWVPICRSVIPNSKTHTLKNVSEKRYLVKTINNWKDKHNSLIYSCYQMFSMRDFIESKGVKLKYNAKNNDTYFELMKTWESMRNHLKKGYKIRYGIPQSFIDIIEEPILIDTHKFTIKILKTEEDFSVEGYVMKNCMSRQFTTGSIYIYISMRCGNKRVNLQYRRGKLMQQFGKSNTPVPILFNESIKILNKKMSKHPDIFWKKEKYDFI